MYFLTILDIHLLKKILIRYLLIDINLLYQQIFEYIASIHYEKVQNVSY